MLLKRKGYWYVRIKHSGSKETWRSLRTKRRPLASRVAEVTAALYREAGVERSPVPVSAMAGAAGVVEEFLAWNRATRSEPYWRMLNLSLRTALRVLPGDLAAWTLANIGRLLTDGLTRSGWAMGHRKPWSPRTANMYREHLRRFWNWAAARGHVSGANPAKAVEKARETRLQPRFHEVTEVEAIMAAADAYAAKYRRSRWLGRAVRVAVGTGARLGELRNMTWKDVDLERNRVRLCGKDREERTVPLAAVAREALEAVPAAERVGQLFPLGPTDRRLRRALVKAGLRPDGLHWLRHDYISHMLLGGVPPHVVRELVGHADLKTTLRYAHVGGAHIEQAPEVLPFGRGSTGVAEGQGRQNAKHSTSTV